MVRDCLCAALVGLALVSVAEAQPVTLRGGVTTTQAPPMMDIYASQDPLKGKPVVMPPALKGGVRECVPPDPTWTLVYQTPPSCYYFAPFPTPIQGSVMTIEEAQQQRLRGNTSRCGAHPWNPRQVICDASVPAPSTPPRGVPPTNIRPPYASNPPDNTPPPGRGPISGRVERVCDLQRLAALVFQRYNTGHPVATVRVTNATKPTYLLLLSGMEWDKLGQSTLTGGAYIAWANIQALDIYRLAIMDAVSDLPSGARLIIAGHSQGGMEGQDVVESLVNRWGFDVPQVITYGSPITVDQTGTHMLHVRAHDEPLQALDRKIIRRIGDIQFSNNGTNPNLFDPDTGSHHIYNKPASGLSQIRVPAVAGLDTPCYEVDLASIREYTAPNLFTRFLGGSQPPPPNQRSKTPLNPGGTVNCFWVSIAQDRMWASGLPFPARCESSRMDSTDIMHVLQRQFGGRTLDDRHGRTVDAGIARHANGEPVLSSVPEIGHALSFPGNRGIVFVDDGPAGTLPGSPGLSHIFNVRRKANDALEFYDAQTGEDAAFWMQRPGLRVWFYRTN